MKIGILGNLNDIEGIKFSFRNLKNYENPFKKSDSLIMIALTNIE